jgi:YesN/AraC family two-component response regulator
VVEAGSGEEALAALHKQSFDLVITDQAMPRMTGVELIQAMEQEWPQLPVILATGYAELPQGAQVNTPLLNKPFTEADLAAILKVVAP